MACGIPHSYNDLGPQDIAGCWPGFGLEERGLSFPFLLSVKDDRALLRRRNFMWKVLGSG